MEDLPIPHYYDGWQELQDYEEHREWEALKNLPPKVRLKVISEFVTIQPITVSGDGYKRHAELILKEPNCT